MMSAVVLAEQQPESTVPILDFLCRHEKPYAQRPGSHSELESWITGLCLDLSMLVNMKLAIVFSNLSDKRFHDGAHYPNSIEGAERRPPLQSSGIRIFNFGEV